MEADRAEERFPGLKVAGDGTEKLILSAIPKSLNGWSVYCVFKGAAGSVSTSKARLHVSDSAKPKPTQIPAAAVTQSPVVPPSGKATTPGTGRNVNAVRRSILQIT